VPFYQPKISFESGSVEGFEALLRWVHPRAGMGSPGLIKEAFEDPVLGVDLGRRMLDKVIFDMLQWQAAGVKFGSIAINVSARELAHPNFSAGVLSRLEAAGIPTNMLEIEVTETVFLDDDTNNVKNELNNLHQNGVTISLDDFGTGYASLTHLNKFPVSWLKIDQSFVKGLGTDPDAAAIIKAVLSLSHSLGIRVIAEGIETLGQWNLLKRRGCDLAQGFLIAKPMSARRVPYFIETWSSVQGDFPDRRVSVQRPKK
jgi:EAL domain-containing protein (putative c-di-GMP-specific phosphodiesterase class I)